MNFTEWLNLVESRQLHLPFMRTPTISLAEIRRRKMFGPVYHGTTEENRQKIGDAGFRVFVGPARTGDVANGYQVSDYNKGIPAPVHHLGFGVYFTTSKKLGQMYNGGTATGLVDYYIDAPRLATINFGAESTMMKWWQQHGYNMQPVANFSSPEVEEQRVQATINLTNTLKSQYDAVWYKGKGLGKLLDGDQVVVFDANNIYRHDTDMDRQETGVGIGDRVKLKNSNTVAKVINMSPMPSVLKPEHEILEEIVGPSTLMLALKNLYDPQSFVDYYAPLFQKLIPKHPKANEWLLTRKTNSGMPYEEALGHYANAMAGNLIKDFGSATLPYALVERVYKKGERIR